MPNFGIDPQNEKVVDARDASENIDYTVEPTLCTQLAERSCETLSTPTSPIPTHA